MSEDREEQESKRKFKVVDRRRFTSEGDMRPGAKEQEAEAESKAAASKAALAAAARQAQPEAAAPQPPQAAPPPPAPNKASAPGPADAGDEDEEESPIPFGAFLQSLAQQCVMQMGLIPFPSGQRQLDLEGARDTLDILGMLKAKTKGNLTDDEKQAFEQILYELRMTFMEVANKVTAAGAPKPPGV